MSVKERIKEYCKYKNIPISTFERQCNLSNGYINAMRKGFGDERLETVLRTYPDIDRVWLLTGEGEMLKFELPQNKDEISEHGKLIPFYDADAAAGNNYEMDMMPSRQVGMIEIGSVLRDCESAIRVYGNSMVPNYPAGCVIGLKLHTDSFIEPGRVYVVETRNNRYLKRLYYTKDKKAFHCLSDNTMKYEDGPRKGELYYQDFEIPLDEVVRLHRVVGVIKRNIL